MSYDLNARQMLSAFVAIAVLAAAGCARNEGNGNAAEQPDSAHPAESSSGESLKPAPVGELVDLAVKDPANEAFLLGTGGTISGTFTPIYDGLVRAVAVQVGTFSRTSDGSLSVKLCPQATECVEGTANMDTFEDNGYAVLPLSRAVNLAANAPVEYSLTRTAGEKAFAIWTYPSDTETTLPDGGKVPRAPKFALKY